MRRHPWVALLLGALAVGGISQGPSSPNRTAQEPTQASIAASLAPKAPTHQATKSTAPTAPAAPKARATSPRGTAIAALASLRVKGRASMSGYGRDRFGQAWLDADRNGCDTRNDILRRDLRRLVLKPHTNGCVALRGVLPDPYGGRPVLFARGEGDQVDIDHVVSLGNAWVTGAFAWPIRKRAALANDPLELLAVDMHLNRQKGDGDAATWLPPYKAFRCAYVARQVAVKKKYRLWVTLPEKAAITRVLNKCPGQPLTPDPTHAPTRVDQNVTDPGVAPSTSSQAPPALMGTSTYYPNCAAVRAAGAAPIHRGQPGYSSHLDRDGDGVGCE